MEQVIVKGQVLASLFSLTSRRVQQLADEGVIVKVSRDKYDLLNSVSGYVKFLQEKAFGKTLGASDTQIERARLLKAQANRAEIENAIKTGELVDKGEMKDIVMTISNALVNSLISLPPSLVSALSLSGGEAAVMLDAMDEEIVTFRQIVSREIEQLS